MLLTALLPATAFAAQDALQPPSVEIENIWPQSVRINGTVTFLVRGIQGLPSEGDNSPGKLVPFINGVPLNGDFPDYVDLKNERVRFTLRLSDASRPQWSSAAGFSPKFIALSAGWTKTGPLPLKKADPANHVTGAPEKVRLESSPFRLALFLVLTIALLAATVVLAACSNLLRDRAIDPTKTGPFTFSLGRSQMAWWLLITAVSFLYIWALTGTWSFTTQALILIGISATTGLSAVLIDASKQENAQRKQTTLLSEKVMLAREFASIDAAVSSAVSAGRMSVATETIVAQCNNERLKVVDAQLSAVQRQATPPISTSNYFKDILTDRDGISLSRFQHLIWTVILGIMFLYAVLTTLQMPTFDDKLLVLLGISGGTYVGFKFPGTKMTSMGIPDPSAVRRIYGYRSRFGSLVGL